MLQDPVKSVLVPLSPEEAQGLAAVGVSVSPLPGHAGGVWRDLDKVMLRSGQAELPLGAMLTALELRPGPDKGSYAAAYAAMVGGDRAAAAAQFAALAFGAGPVAPSLYGLALALEELGQHEEAEALAAFVSDLPGYNDPRAAALAGYAAFQRRQSKSARIHLAKAARIARLQPEFRGVQRFAQRVLLMQQFALGD